MIQQDLKRFAKTPAGPIQKFFWFCAGADTEVLEHCATEQNRYANVGAVIFLVACLAGISMFFATQTLTSNIFLGILVSVVWASIIFVLDRMIVSSIDKSKPFWRQLLSAFPRLILAVLIAIIISRPIEVRIFRAEILNQIKKDEVLEATNYQQLLLQQYQLEDVVRQDSLRKVRLEAEIARRGSEPETATYNQLKEAEEEMLAALQKKEARRKEKSYQEALVNLNFLGKQPDTNRDYYELVERKETQADGSILLVEEAVLMAKWAEAKKQWKRTVNAVERPIRLEKKALKKLRGEISEEVLAYNKSIDADIALATQKQRSSDSLVIASNTMVRTKKDDFIQQNESTGITFFKELRALNNLGYDIVQVDAYGIPQRQKNALYWAKWLILLLFLVIEIAPLLVKLMTPYEEGGYDSMLRSKKEVDTDVYELSQRTRRRIEKAKLKRLEGIGEQ
ncbi:MAG: DUF4407 domain-containing protein [Bacteroidota bacterium]